MLNNEFFTEKKGIDNCNHEWIFSQPVMTTFAQPPIFIQYRICENCGRKEFTKTISINDYNKEKYFSLENKFDK